MGGKFVQFVVIQLLNSISYGALLYMIAVGFSLVFGFMRITNMTHVVFFMIGAYYSYTIFAITGSFTLGTIAAAIITGAVGFVVFKFFLFKLQGQSLNQILLCNGFMFLLNDLLLAIFGGYPKHTPTPGVFNYSIDIIGASFPVYRLFLIVFGVILAIFIDLAMNRTKIGALVRSGVDDAETVQAMGIDINKLFIIVYVGGTVLAAIGGSLGGPILGMEPNMCFTLLPLAMAIVIVGGMGNLRGAFYGSMFIAAMDNFGRALFPELAYFTIFAPMVVVLVFRPEGLFVSKRKEAKAR